MVSSTVPKLELKWPPVWATLCKTCSRNSSASCLSWWRGKRRRSAGVSIDRSSWDMGAVGWGRWCGVGSVRTPAHPIGQLVQTLNRMQAGVRQGLVGLVEQCIGVCLGL